MKTRYRPYRRRPPVSAGEQRAAAGGCGCLLLGFIVLAAFGSCVGGANNFSPALPPPAFDESSTDLPTPGRVDAAQPPQVEACHYPPPVYDGQSCFPGGEPVKVTRVIDGDTVELADRRVVRLLGVEAPEAKSCAGPGATNFTRGKVEGKWALMYREPGVTVDKYSRELAYLQAPLDLGGPFYPASYGDDIGYELTLNGWAEPFSDSDANATYDENIQRVYETSTHQSDGMFAPPCGTPEPYNVPDYDYPNLSPGDGDGDGGESRLCRGKWYC